MLVTLDRLLLAIEKSVAATSLLSLLCLSLLQIFARNFFDTGFPQLELLNRHLLIIAGLMGAGIAITQSRHIKIDALAAVLSETVRRKLRVPLLLFSACICAALAYYSVIFCIDEWQYAPANERWTLPLLLAYPMAFTSMSLHFVFAVFIADVVRKDDTT